MKLLLGVAVADITPRSSVWLTGFGGRNHKSEGVRDPLKAKAMALSDGKTTAVLMSLDLIGANALLTEIRETVKDSTGIDKEQLLLCFSHTHSAPNVMDFNGLGLPEPEYGVMLVQTLAEVVGKALEFMKPVKAFYGYGTSNANVNRRSRSNDGTIQIKPNLHGSLDRTVSTLAFINEENEFSAVLYSYAMHAVCRNDYLISADWPGAASNLVEQQYKAPCFFIQGCCGDINASDMFNEKSHEIMGAQVAGGVFEGLNNLQPFKAEPINSNLKDILLPPAPLEDEETIKQKIAVFMEQETALRKDNHEHSGIVQMAQAKTRYARQTLNWRSEGAPDIRIPVHLLQIGEARILGIGAEALNIYQRDFIRQSPHKPTLIAGYANEVACYLPAGADYDYGGYEPYDSMVFYNKPILSREAERLIRTAGYSLLDVKNPDWTPYPPSI